MSAATALHVDRSGENPYAQPDAWTPLGADDAGPDFHAAWLGIVCRQIDGVAAALLLLDRSDGLHPVASWPDPARDLTHLVPVAQCALRERHEVVWRQRAGAGRDSAVQLGCPFEVPGWIRGALALEVAAPHMAHVRDTLQHIEWANGWLRDRYRADALADAEARVARLSLATDLVAITIEEQRFSSATLALVNELASRLASDRASIGLERGASIRVEAISHTAALDRKSNLVRSIAAAMDEVLDVGDVVRWPPDASEDGGALLHGQLASELRDVAVLSVPLMAGGRCAGVLTLERSRGEPFDAGTTELARTIGLVLGPALALKRSSERGLVEHGGAAASGALAALFGPRRPGLKLVAVLVAVLALVLVFGKAEYRVTARTVVEGAVQRAALAPFDGYIAESLVRAGDTVQAGQTLLRLDDSDLRLERRSLLGEQQQLAGRQRQALAIQDRVAIAVLGAQADQVMAQLALLEDKLARATLVAPFDGTVVSGDHSQLLGTPVEQGKLLFEVAPLDAYRLILQVDDRDIGHVRVGQHGELALSGMPHQRLPFVVRQLTPISTAQDGRNTFRVEARMQAPAELLRPGMEGIGKVSSGTRSLWWIWTHGLVDWAWLTAWKWLP